MSDRLFNVLFLCTANSARSILAESILAKDGAGRFRAFSAGSQPRGAVNPLALETLRAFGYPSDGLRSKSWEEFEQPGAPAMDFVITVCDNAAGEVCPIWPGHPLQAHWGIEDPAAAPGTQAQQLAAFATAFGHLKNRIALFTAVPIAGLEGAALRERIAQIGTIEGRSRGTGEK